MRSLALISLLYLFSNFANSAAPYALFSPYQGVQAFEKIYKNVENAKNTAHLAIYSWSDKGITDAMIKLLKENPRVKLRVVLHRPLANKESTLKKVAKLEKLGAMFKKAKMNMHEKFVLIDSRKLINSSANMSGGAKKKYSEDFVFIDSDGETDNEKIIESFEKEFSILWNTSDDIVTPGELQKADVLNFELSKKNNPNVNNDMKLISSSMNFTYSLNKASSADLKKGRLLKMKKKPGLNENTYVIAKHLIKAIDNARTSVWMSVNHFNIYSVSKALVRAAKRGIDVKLYVDNQEFKTNIRDTGRKSIEMTPRFVRDFKKVPSLKDKKAPVRVKFYSHAPHHSSWYLNHHKYILIDYNTAHANLFSGSYNISKNAELKQFDNLVHYTTNSYQDLYDSYAKNFMYNWTLNRTKNDKPVASILSKYTQVHNDEFVYIHAKESSDSISLTWAEAIKLKKNFAKSAPGVFQGLFRNKGCSAFNFKTKKFFGGRGCK